MKQETYEKAKQLVNDIATMTKQFDECEKERHWITISTPRYKDDTYSVRFQHELRDWMQTKMQEYKKEFEELV